VLKLLQPGTGGHANWPAAPEPAHPYYWRREAEAYASGLLQRLAPPLRAPDLHACIERADGTVALWLEDVRLPHSATWDVERYGLAARHLGRAQGELAVDPPREEWLSRRWLREYVRLREPLVAESGHGPTHELWSRREEVLARIEGGPQTLCHLDWYPANLFGDPHETVAIDWAYCGLGALGEDAANFGPDTLLDAFVPAARGAELVRAIWDGYVAGLADAGWDGDVRFTFVATVALKYAWIPAQLAAGRGRPEWHDVVPLLDELADEALELASSA
jgi:hypothetical protein